MPGYMACKPGDEFETNLVCPCGSTKIDVMYTADPAQYTCMVCKKRLVDRNQRSFVITQKEAKSMRPRIYGLPACEKCDHAPHEVVKCEWCQPHVYDLQYA